MKIKVIEKALIDKSIEQARTNKIKQNLLKNTDEDS